MKNLENTVSAKKHAYSSKNKHSQRGVTMVEVGIVVAIAATLLVIALKIVPETLANNRANAEMQELPSVITNIQKTYANFPSFEGMTLDNVIRLDGFPKDRATIPSSGLATATNRWGGQITLSPANLSSTNDIGRLVYSNVGTRECKTVLQGVSGLVRRIYVDPANGGVAGGGTLIKDDGANLNLSLLGTACGSSMASITYDLGK